MSNQEKFFGTAREMMIGLFITVWIVLVLVAVESRWFPSSHSVRCAMITDIGPIQTMAFDDENVKEEGGVIKGKTTVYRLGNHEICLIEGTDK